MATESKHLIQLGTGLFAVLCAGAIPLWILGVPGVKNDYARGLELGMFVIVAYPFAWWCVYGVSKRMNRDVGEHGIQGVDRLSSTCFLLIFAIAVVCLRQAFVLMM